MVEPMGEALVCKNYKVDLEETFDNNALNSVNYATISVLVC